jgi:hypothetical protein
MARTPHHPTQFTTGGRVPEVDQIVHASRHNRLTIGRKRNAEDTFISSLGWASSLLSAT